MESTITGDAVAYEVTKVPGSRPAGIALDYRPIEADQSKWRNQRPAPS